MAKFKSTAHHAVRVVHYNPRVALFRRVAAIMAVAAAVLAAGAGGWYVGQGRQLVVGREQAEMTGQLESQQAELADLRHQVAVLSRGNKVERQASETVRREVRVLNEKIYGLEKEITFYRSIMSPGSRADKLSVQRLELASRPENNLVRFKLVLTQVTEKREMISGAIEMEVAGKQDGESVRLAVADLGGPQDIRFRFRYFQELDGEFVLPEGFQPEAVHVTARSSGRRPVEAVREFTWLVQEIGVHVRQG